MSTLSTTTIGAAKLGANDTVNFGGSGSYGDVSTEQLYHSLVDILGPPRRGMEWNNNMGYKMTHEDLPDLWRDKVTYLGERIEGTTVKSRLAVTTIIAPIRKVRGSRIDWSVWSFDVASAVPRVLPHEGIPPIAQYSERRDTRQMERKGHSMIFELPALDSPEGKVRYNRGMLGMSAAVIYGIVYDTLWNLLWPAREEIEEKAKLTARDLSILRMHRFEREQFAGFNKSKEGFSEVVKRLADAMYEISDGAAPWVLVPPGTAARFGTSELQRVTHVELDATQSFLKAVNGKSDDLFSFDGKTHIVEMPGMSILTTDGEKPIRDLFLRQKMMLHHATNAETEASIEHGFAANSRAAPTPNAQRTVYIYGSGSQKKEPITPLKALRKSRIYDESGALPSVEMITTLNANGNGRSLSYAEACGLDPRTGEYYDDADEGVPHRAIHPFFRYDEENGGIKPVDYAAECDPSAVSKDWFKLGGSAILNKAKVSEEEWDALVEFLGQCEDGESTPEYWQALIQANAPASVNAAGEFVGVTAGALNAEAVKTMGYDGNHRLWAPGPTGILRLPINDGTYTIPAHPVGFGSAAGLAAIANAGGNQAFYELSGVAKKHLATLTKLYTAVRYMPNNPLIKRKFQALFNIGTDSRNAMLNSALASVRHGVYLPYLKKKVPGNTTNPPDAGGYGVERASVEEINDLSAMDLSFADIVDNNRRLRTGEGAPVDFAGLFTALETVAAGYSGGANTPSGGTAVRVANGDYLLLPRAMAGSLGVTPALAQLSRFGPRVGRAFAAIAYALSLNEDNSVLEDDSKELNNFSSMLYESCSDEQAKQIVLGLLATFNLLNFNADGTLAVSLDALKGLKGQIKESVVTILADHKSYKSTGKVKAKSALQAAVKAGKAAAATAIIATDGNERPVKFTSTPGGEVDAADDDDTQPGGQLRLAARELYTRFATFTRNAAGDGKVYVVNLLRGAGTLPKDTTDVEDVLASSTVDGAAELQAAISEARRVINLGGTGGRIAQATNLAGKNVALGTGRATETVSQVRYTLEDLDRAQWYLAPGIQLGPGAAKHILFSNEAYPVRLADKIAPNGAHTQPYSATAAAGDDYMLNPEDAPEMVPLMSSSVIQPGQLHTVAHTIRGASVRSAAKASSSSFSGGVQRFGDSYGTSGAGVSPMDFFDDEEVMPETGMPAMSGAHAGRQAMPVASGPIRGSEEARKVHCAFTSRNAQKHMSDLHDLGLTSLQAAGARLAMGTSVSRREDLERLLQAGLDIPLRFLYFRYPEFVTGNGVIVLGNGECCINAQGPVQTSMSRTGVDMMVSVVMAYSGALVMLNGRKKAVMANMFLAGLAGGLTTELADDLASIIDVDDKKRPSVLAYGIPVAQRKGLFMHELSPTGFVPQATGETEMDFGSMPQFATAGFYNRLDNTANRQGAFSPVDYINYFKQAGAIPRISDPTETWHFNNQTGYFDNVDPNQDGLGATGYAAGSNPVYEGSATQTFFPTSAEYGASMSMTAQLLV